MGFLRAFPSFPADFPFIHLASNFHVLRIGIKPPKDMISHDFIPLKYIAWYFEGVFKGIHPALGICPTAKNCGLPPAE